MSTFSPRKLPAVAGQHDLVADRDPQLLERREVLGPGIVRIDDLPRGTPADPVAVERRKGVRAGGILVDRERGLFQVQDLRLGAIELERRLARG